jgi:hypothetical protein
MKEWAWWGTLIYLLAMSISALLSFYQYSLYEIAQMLNPPEYEMIFLDQLALLHDVHLTSLVTAPLFAALGLLIYAKRYFYRVTKKQTDS